ncbi:MAG TPA: hypothetical protein VHV79_01505 [Mycobacteriales bacterium]|nr:hypothetical protein [Mycobacteriales bacterium]
MLRLIFAIIGAVLLIVGVAFADNFRGTAVRFAGWARRTNSPLLRARGPHRWLNNTGFQAIVFRVYGAVVGLAGVIILAVVVRH